jgi:hypothetical protein
MTVSDALFSRKNNPPSRQETVLTQRVFSDTEFASFEKPELVSIGLVTLNREEFYAGVGYGLEACSGFAKRW